MTNFSFFLGDSLSIISVEESSINSNSIIHHLTRSLLISGERVITNTKSLTQVTSSEGISICSHPFTLPFILPNCRSRFTPWFQSTLGKVSFEVPIPHHFTRYAIVAISSSGLYSFGCSSKIFGNHCPYRYFILHMNACTLSCNLSSKHS